jgi:hypothetical protein
MPSLSICERHYEQGCPLHRARTRLFIAVVRVMPNLRRTAASGAKRSFDVSQVLTVKSPGYSLCYLLVGYAIHPPTRHRLFIDFLVERFSAGPEAGIGRSSAMDA